MLLCNLTREKNHANSVYEAFSDQTKTLESLIKLFMTRDVKNETNFDYISYLLSNLCQLHEVRMLVINDLIKNNNNNNRNSFLFIYRWLMDSDNLQKLLPFLCHDSQIRRAGVIMTIKNCCFELGNF